jgi:hypothetical protein
MKNKGLILSVMAALFISLLSCNAQTADQSTENEMVSTDNVEVYYFHYERRCATCMAVESESEKALNELYPEEMKSGKMIFISVNLEDKTNDALAEKLKVDGQSLLIVKGQKQENLTNTAFMHARSNPEKLKKAIQESVEKL